MFYHKCLFDEHGSSTEADFIIKLHGLIPEELFLGSDVRLVWGDTNSPFNDSTNARIDLRLTMIRSQLPDLGMGESARATTPSKFYNDKLNSVLVSLTHLNQHIQRTKMDLESAKQVAIPFVITQGLESDVYAPRLVDKEWCVVTKLADIDIPSTISEVKQGKINDYLNQLHVLKQHCIDVEDTITSSRQTCRSMRRLNKKAIGIQESCVGRPIREAIRLR